MEPAIAVDDFSFTYSGSDQPAVEDVNLRVEEKEFIVLAGPSGCGKTTLCKSFVGLIPHFYSGASKGVVKILGVNVADSSIYEISQRVGYVFQNPDNQLVMTTVRRDTAFGLENLGLPRREMERRVDQTLALLDLAALADEPIYALSGGQKQKLAIAGILAMNPKILILDEPTAYFSPASALSFLELLSKLNRDLDLTILLVEHRLDLAARYASRLVVMDMGMIRFQGNPRDFFIQSSSDLSGINTPSVIQLYHLLRERGYTFSDLPLSTKEASWLIREALENVRG
ncbi:MAG: ATP-binding cassette domain-containing protein [Nitrososphaeria archaeon]|nr:ATP-binding cassette domain-containing protein [Nitrososphaeria archaeon]